jgi:hypothetical protein
MIDMQTVRVSGLNNRVPGPVLFIEVVSSAVALALLGFYLATLGRGLAQRSSRSCSPLPSSARCCS